tara:strand:+ start:97 stop:771 length:675 start_codon:yes stop_codon:yes gene_type:complete
MGAALDPRVQELQETMEAHLPYLNECIFANYRGYFDEQKFTTFTGYSGDFGQVEFTPKEHFETFDNVVSHSIPGADVQGTTIQLGQLLQMKGISLNTFRVKHPFVDDPEAEGRRVDEEQLEDAVMAGIQQQAAQGTMPILYVATIEKYRKDGHDIFESIRRADEEIREQQAQEIPEPGAGQMMAPEAAPGLAGGPPGPPGAPGPPGQEPGIAEMKAALLAGSNA